MEQAISTLGRSLPLKRELQNNSEVVSFEYQPNRPIEYSQMGIGITVYVRYFSDLKGTRVKVTVMPTILTIFGYVFGFGITIIGIANLLLDKAFFLVLIFFYLLLWWESIETKKAIWSMFQDAVTK